MWATQPRGLSHLVESGEGAFRRQAKFDHGHMGHDLNKDKNIDVICEAAKVMDARSARNIPWPVQMHQQLLRLIKIVEESIIS